MKKFLAQLSSIGALVSILSAQPKPVSDAINNLDAFFAKGLSTASQVEVMIVPPSIFIDPPLDANRFPRRATIKIAVNAPSAYGFVKLALGELRSTKWDDAPAPGYPRWYWRVVNPSGTTIFDLLIDEENSVVCYAGTWYRVDRKLVNRLSHGFLDLSTRQLLLPKDKQS